MKKVSTSANSALGLDLLRNVCPAEKRTKHSNILLLRLVRFSVGQMLSIHKHTQNVCFLDTKID